MKKYRLREGDVVTVDLKTQLTTAGSDSVPGAMLVPQGMKFITAVLVSAIQNMAAATSFTGFLRLEGPGLVNSQESIALVAGGNAVATGGNAVNPVKRLPVNFPVTEANEIQIFAEMCGTDIGGMGVVVGIEFSDTVGEGASEHRTMTVEGDLPTVDARAALTAQGSVASPSLIVPAGYTKIDKIFVAAASEGLADGKQSFFLRIGGNAVLGGEQVLPISTCGRIAPQAGSDAAPQVCPVVIHDNLEIEVTPSDSISVWAEGAGDDTGSGRAVVTLVFGK